MAPQWTAKRSRRATPPSEGSDDRRPRAFYGVTGEERLVAAIAASLIAGPCDVNSLSSKFASEFNRIVRGSDDTPYKVDKRNDGSFKKWLLACGFTCGPLFDRNKSLVHLPGRASAPAGATAIASGRVPRAYRGKHGGYARYPITQEQDAQGAEPKPLDLPELPLWAEAADTVDEDCEQARATELVQGQEEATLGCVTVLQQVEQRPQPAGADADDLEYLDVELSRHMAWQQRQLDLLLQDEAALVDPIIEGAAVADDSCWIELVADALGQVLSDFSESEEPSEPGDDDEAEPFVLVTPCGF